MRRVLSPGGVALVLEFRRVWAPLAPGVRLVQLQRAAAPRPAVAGDAASYRYLAESIRVHPDQATLKAMMEQAGFEDVEVHNLMAGVVALHVGRVYSTRAARDHLRTAGQRCRSMSRRTLTHETLARTRRRRHGALLVAVTDVDARRIGGGRSLGAQRSITPAPSVTARHPARPPTR